MVDALVVHCHSLSHDWGTLVLTETIACYSNMHYCGGITVVQVKYTGPSEEQAYETKVIEGEDHLISKV